MLIKSYHAQVNKYQTTNHAGHDANLRSFSGGGAPPSSHVPPAVPPDLFCLPKDQAGGETAEMRTRCTLGTPHMPSPTQ